MAGATSSIDTTGIANTVYHGAVVGILSMGYAMVGYKLLKIKPPDLGKLGVEDAAKITALSAGSLATQSWLVAQGILPDSITNRT